MIDSDVHDEQAEHRAKHQELRYDGDIRQEIDA